MKDDLLWVYEGLTEYLGEMLTARSGLRNLEMSREALAYVSAIYDHRPGRDWRPLQDTADAASFLYDAGSDWANWRRGTDFYDEGELLWLDVDETMRRMSNGKKSLNGLLPRVLRRTKRAAGFEDLHLLMTSFRRSTAWCQMTGPVFCTRVSIQPRRIRRTRLFKTAAGRWSTTKSRTGIKRMQRPCEDA